MKRLILGALLLCGAAGAAEVSVDVAGGQLIFTDEKCSSAVVLEQLRPETRRFYFNGRYELSDRVVPLCWRPAPNGDALWVVDEEGDAVVIPLLGAAI